nr:cytochrome P450 [Aspergillus sp.]
MVSTNMTPFFSIAFASGVVIHLLYFRKEEHHLYPQRYVQEYAMLPFGIDTFLLCRVPCTASEATYDALHPKPLFQVIAELHVQHSHFVRTGPSDLSITHPDAVNVVHGLGSPCTKNAFYDLAAPFCSLHSYLTVPFGGVRVTDVIKLFNFYSFDVMGGLAFGESFAMLDMANMADNHWAIRILLNSLVPMEYFVPIWLFRLMMAIPGLAKDVHRFMDFSEAKIRSRMKVSIALGFSARALFRSSATGD